MELTLPRGAEGNPPARKMGQTRGERIEKGGGKERDPIERKGQFLIAVRSFGGGKISIKGRKNHRGTFSFVRGS